MSTNEVRSIQQQVIKRKEAQKQQGTVPEPSVGVFSNADVGARVSLAADASNSLFSGTEFFVNQPQAGEVKTDVLPEEFKEYTGKDAEALRKLTPKQLEQAKKFLDTKLSGTNIAAITMIFNNDEIDKIHQHALEMQEQAGGKDKVFMLSLVNDKYDQSAYKMSALNFNFEMSSEVLDKDLNVRSVENLTEYTDEKGERYRIQEAYDLKTNTVSKVRYDIVELDEVDSEGKKAKTFQATYELRSKMKEDGTMISREYSRPSKVKGVNTVDILTEGGVKTVSDATKKKNGKVIVKKDMESLDGTRTQYKYKDDPKGNRYMHYKITTKEGEVLLDNRKTFEVVSDNEFRSTFNDKSYTMKVEGDKLTVTCDQDEKKTATIDLGKIQGDKDKIISSIKRLSGEELLEMSETVDNIEGMENELSSYYKPTDRSLHSGDDLFVVLHELGHAKDFKNADMKSPLKMLQSIDKMISQNKEVQDIYNKEKQAFNEAFPDLQREHVDYFINTLTHYSGPTGGLRETIAEGNAIHNTPLTNELLTLRTQYLQQYFPRTMAKLDEMYKNNPLQKNEPKKFKLDFPKLEIPPIKFPPSPGIPTTK